MEKLNVEIKARCSDPERIKSILENMGAFHKGLDHQIDTYFGCDKGRLKLRQGNIEQSLIFYKRENQSGPKQSDIVMEKLEASSGLRDVLEAAYGIKVVVDKKRDIYFIDNVKFHVDQVKDLGSFMEIEAIDDSGDIGREKLLKQCEEYMDIFAISQRDLVDCSYSDLLSKIEV